MLWLVALHTRQVVKLCGKHRLSIESPTCVIKCASSRGLHVAIRMKGRASGTNDNAITKWTQAGKLEPKWQ